MAFRVACRRADLWQGEMLGLELDNVRVLLVDPDGEPRAYRDACPHDGRRLSDGKFDRGRLICRGHLWVFDARTGTCENPSGVCLQRFPTRCEDGVISVDVDDAK